MATVISTECLSTIVKNVSGGELVCPFLPPHGRTLDEDEVLVIPGDLMSMVCGNGRSNRKRDGLLYALTNDLLEIRSTPNPVFVDETSGVSKVLTLHGDAVQFDAACYDHSSVSEE